MFDTSAVSLCHPREIRLMEAWHAREITAIYIHRPKKAVNLAERSRPGHGQTGHRQTDGENAADESKQEEMDVG